MPRLFVFAFVCAAGVVAGAQGALVHRYSFDGDVNDSIGGAHGTIVDAGESNVSYVDGKLDLSSNVGYNYPFNQSDAYAQLPGSLIANAFNGGAPGELTIEIWAQAAENRRWAALFSAGKEEWSGAGMPKNYIQFIPLAGDFNDPMRITSSERATMGEKWVNRFPAMSTTEPTHLVIAYHLTRIWPFPTPRYQGGFSVYANGSFVGSIEYPLGLELNLLTDARVWLGRSQYDSDPIFDGAYDELRIYNSRLTAADVARNYQLGPNAVPEPHAFCLAAIAGAAMASFRKTKRGL